MKNTKIIPSKIANSQRLKSFRTSAAVMLTTLILLVAAATTVATAQTYTDLHNFRDGADLGGALAQGRNGDLYIAGYGGANSCGEYICGVVFRITPSGKVKAIYNFDGIDGIIPSNVTLGTDGNFYGTTEYGGANNYGTIFKITPSGSLTTLYSLTGGTDGADPLAPPIQGTDGNFYGTTSTGTAYKITRSGTFTSLASLPGGADSPLLQATDGSFYGTTWDGGLNNCEGETCGTLFRMTPKGVVTIVYDFDSTHGGNPDGPLIQGSDGNFYGTTSLGGSYSWGVVFKLTAQGAITVLHNFGDPNYPNDGLLPSDGLVQATDGNFYGTTLGGGTGPCNEWWGLGCGVIFQITPAAAYSVLYNFDYTHGANPYSNPMQHTNGKIYGLTSYGGPSDAGVFYSFDVGLAPFVSLVSTTRKIGKTVEILGQGFTGTTAVAFNGTAATFAIKSDTYLTATVPAGATTGFVTVTTPTGTLTSNKQFRVKP